MLIRCPSCKTTYKVSDELLRGTTPVFRCSRCKHTFEIDPAKPSESDTKTLGSEPPAQRDEDEQELTFTFPSEVNETAKPTVPENTRQDSMSASAAGDPKQEPSEQNAQAWPMAPAESKDKMRRPVGAATQKTTDSSSTVPPPPQPEQPITAAQDTTDKVLPLEPYRDQPASVLPYLTLFMLLVIFFGLLTAFQHVHPATSENMVKKIPLLGTSVLKNNHLKNGVDLQSLRAGHQTIQGNREVFVITGVALNLNPVVIREVRVAGHLYNQEGAEIEQQTIWIGNAISPKIIRGMTIQDISDLQRLKPLKTFDIPPGDSVPFTIVFLKAAKSVKDFGCEVLSAEAEI
jgi:predicted Zn finger-like uncharacterized protein